MQPRLLRAGLLLGALVTAYMARVYLLAIGPEYLEGNKVAAYGYLGIALGLLLAGAGMILFLIKPGMARHLP